MKIFISIILLFFGMNNHSSFKKKEGVRIQGYLLVRNSGEKNEDKLTIDTMEWYYFVPIVEIDNLKNTIDSLDAPSKHSLYLPLSLTSSKGNIEILNLSFKKVLKTNFKVSQLKEYNNYKTTKKTTISYKNSTYHIVYIDGIWDKINVPYKYSNRIIIDKYMNNRLDNEKSDYHFYFLKELKMIAYNLKINEKL